MRNNQEGHAATGSSEPSSQYQLQNDPAGGSARPDSATNNDEQYSMSVTKLLYSSSSYYAIAKPGK